MLLGFLTVLVTAVAAICHCYAGLPRAFTILVNVVLAGLVAFGFFEPLASGLELGGYEDALCLLGLFVPVLCLLCVLTWLLAPGQVRLPPQAARAGAVTCGALTGYLAFGFLVCLLQTLPLPREFLGFRAEIEPGRAAMLRRVLPPDRVWLAMMHQAGRLGFAWAPDRRSTPTGASSSAISD